ncbi:MULTISPECIES: hypothetical protein [unclassified Sphingopyxis]|jgi:hypothetical protein|uniref:hypothetical protein n=1 Tax=unclassified Sphingopyxis TaxID=2614943 RepID=UPI0012E3B361|nr:MULTISPECIES: hypothetical protein [unclassified Sphingopyxis]
MSRNYPFFRRPSPNACVVETRIAAILPLWLLVLALAIGGYIVNGPAVFTLDYWLDGHGIRYNPITGIPIIVASLIALLYWTADCILGLPCYLGILDENLVVHRRRVIPLEDLQIEKMSMGRRGLFIPRKSRPSSPLFISSMLANTSRSELQNRLVQIISAQD